jgi:hypothetical protein
MARRVVEIDRSRLERGHEGGREPGGIHFQAQGQSLFTREPRADPAVLLTRDRAVELEGAAPEPLAADHGIEQDAHAQHGKRGADVS